MVSRKQMDARKRVATCMLLNKLAMNQNYSQQIGLQDSSHYVSFAENDKNMNGKNGKCRES